MIYALGFILFFLSFYGAREMSKSSKRWDQLIKQKAALYAVDWKDLKAIAMIESSLGANPSVAHGLANPMDIEKSKSSDGKSWGLFQITIPTLRDMDPQGDAIKLNDPNYSAHYAARYLAWISARIPKSDPRSKEWIIKSYNQGLGNTYKERSGAISKGFADQYWDKFVKARKQIEEEERLA